MKKSKREKQDLSCSGHQGICEALSHHISGRIPLEGDRLKEVLLGEREALWLLEEMVRSRFWDKGLIREVLRLFPGRDVLKAVKRASYRLTQLSIQAELPLLEEESVKRVEFYTPTLYMSCPSLMDGSRTFIVEGKEWCLNISCSLKPKGIRINKLSIKDFKRSRSRLTELFVGMPLGYLKGMCGLMGEEVLAREGIKGGLNNELLTILEGCEEKGIDEVLEEVGLNRFVPFREEYLKALILWEVPGLSSFDPSRLAPFKQKLKDLFNSPIITSAAYVSERKGEIVSEAISSLWPDHSYQVSGLIFKELAYYNLKMNKEIEAEHCLFWGKALSSKDSPVTPNPYLRALVEAILLKDTMKRHKNTHTLGVHKEGHHVLHHLY